MFYDIYESLCKERGEKPYQLPLKLGASSNSIVAGWKQGRVPRPSMLKKIADYFGVSEAYMLGYDLPVEKAKPAPQEQPIKELSPARQALLDSISDLSDAQLFKLISIIQEAKRLIQD